MKHFVIILLLFFLSATGCKKDNKPAYSGTITIDNILYGEGPYYAMGFSVPTGKLVSTLNNPLDLITVLADYDTNYVVRKIFLSTSNYANSFSLYGTYNDESAAIAAFDNLKSFTDPVWTEIADIIEPDQIWLYRTSSNKYAKIRVTGTFTLIFAYLFELVL